SPSSFSSLESGSTTRTKARMRTRRKFDSIPRQGDRQCLGAHLDTATGAPASGPAPLREPEPETPGRRPALRHSMSPLVAVSGCAQSLDRRALPTECPCDTVPPRDNLTTNNYAIRVSGRFEDPIRRCQV